MGEVHREVEAFDPRDLVLVEVERRQIHASFQPLEEIMRLDFGLESGV